ncbi:MULTISPECIES: hypothetical protein [unclassified Janthinobacterium]|uniref:hypothetical protein n=1 Tax=unclassified Janthinobacterium TaxID=2610881 RepID=UPI0016098078|nr:MULTISPECIES: hypothetical protein [unclassified Janthinobacterium]MBB5606332.1 hypothetical protein [Janthinobacterium sp. S3T4]MBB5611796.1 hypothetical protein [Janthinobacterium sp. S3M3]
MNLRDELKIAPVNELRHVGSRTKGSMGQTEIDEYEEITPDGKVIARYTVTEHTNLRGLNTTRSIQQH